LLRRELTPLAQMRADRMTRRDIVACVEKVASASVYNQCVSVVRTVLGWAIDTGRLEGPNPAVGIRRRSVQPRERTLSDDELRLIWTAAWGMSDYERILKLLVLTGLRRQEIGGLRWSEVQERPDGPVLVLPSSRMKAGRVHVVPLTAAAMSLLPPRREGYENVFGRWRGRPFSGWSMCKAKLDAPLIGMEQWCIHDLRRTMATGMAELGVTDEIISRVLGHAPQGVTRVHYNRSPRLAECREALQRWADHVTGIVGPITADRGLERGAELMAQAQAALASIGGMEAFAAEAERMLGPPSPPSQS
jgi:integrase